MEIAFGDIFRKIFYRKVTNKVSYFVLSLIFNKNLMRTKSETNNKFELSSKKKVEDVKKIQPVYVSNETAYEMTLEAQGTLLYNGQ